MVAERSSTEGRDDVGLTLIELIVGVVITTLILTATATILINSLITQNGVLSTSEATNRGQMVSSAVERAMRNALYSWVSSDGSVLRVETTFDDVGDSRHCQAFRMSGGVAQIASSATSVSTPTWGTWVGDGAQNWTIHVRHQGATAFFEATDTGVEYSFAIETEAGPANFSGETHRRWKQEGYPGCW